MASTYDNYGASSGAPKPIAHSFDVRYLPHALRPQDTSSARLTTGCLDSPVVSSARRAPIDHSSTSHGGFKPPSFHVDINSANANASSSLSSASFSPIAQLSGINGAARFPLQAPATCELQLNQWIHTTTNNSPVQQIQHLSPAHPYSSVAGAGLPSSVSTNATSSSYHSSSTATSNTTASDYEYLSSPNIYGSPSFQTQQHQTVNTGGNGGGAQSSVPASSFPINDAATSSIAAGTGWPSSAPATTSTNGMDLYAQMLMMNMPAFPASASSALRHPLTTHYQQSSQRSPLETSNFYSGFSGLGIQQGGAAHVQQHSPLRDDVSTVSPRDVMASTTVVDADDFGGPGSGSGSYGSGVGMANGDFPVVGGAFGGSSGYSPEALYRGFGTGEDLAVGQASQGGVNSLFGFGPASPPEFSTQFPVDLEEDSSMGGMENSMATVRPRAVVVGRFGLGLATKEDLGSQQSGLNLWDGPASAPVTSEMHQQFAVGSAGRQRPSLHAAFSESVRPKMEFSSPMPMSAPALRDEEDEEDEDDEDADDGDDDYVEGSVGGSRIAGPHRGTVRRHSTSTGATRPWASKRGSPYARPRPSTNSLSSTSTSTTTTKSTTSASGEKKPKAVKWESTKPKYWIPEGFDPLYDQKSRGRGVETIHTSSSEDDVGLGHAVADWPRDYLPHDWRELVRGRGNPARPFVCPAVNCGKTFQRSEHAKRHAGSLHTPDAVKVPCPYPGCEHKSTRGDNLKQHMDSHRRKKGGSGAADAAFFFGEDKEKTVRPRRGSAVGGGRTRRRANVKNEDDDF